MAQLARAPAWARAIVERTRGQGQQAIRETIAALRWVISVLEQRLQREQEHGPVDDEDL